MATKCDQVFNSEVLPDVEAVVDAYIEGGGVSPVHLRSFLVDAAGDGINQYLSDDVLHDLLKRAAGRTGEAKAKKIISAVKKHREGIVPEQTKEYLDRADRWVSERLGQNPKSPRVRQQGLDVEEPKKPGEERPYKEPSQWPPRSKAGRQSFLDIDLPQPGNKPTSQSRPNDAPWPPVSRDARQLANQGLAGAPLPTENIPLDPSRPFVDVPIDGRRAYQMGLDIEGAKKPAPEVSGPTGEIGSVDDQRLAHQQELDLNPRPRNQAEADKEIELLDSIFRTMTPDARNATGDALNDYKNQFKNNLRREFMSYLTDKYGNNAEVYGGRDPNLTEKEWRAFLEGKAKELGESLGIDSEGQVLGAIVGPDNKVAVFIPDHVKGIANRLNKTYHPPTVKGRDPATIKLLTEVGGYFYMKGHRDFYDWALHTTAAVGTRMHPADMVAAFQGIHPAAFKKVESNTAIVRAARKRAYASLSPDKMDAFLEDMANVDTSADDVSEQVNSILKKHRRITPIDYLYEVPGLLRAVRTSWDASAPFRQASVLTVGGLLDKNKRKIVIRAFGEMLATSSDKMLGVAKMMKVIGQNVESSEDFGLSVLREIESRPNALNYDRFNLARSKVGGDTVDLTAREEAYMTNVVQLWRESNIRPLRKMAEGISASERMYSVYLNRLRADTFDLMSEQLIHDGITPDVNPEVYEALAGWINDMTGRSTLPQLGRRREQGALFNAERDEATAGKLLSSIFFALRFQTSRAKTIVAPVRLVSSVGSTYAQQAAAKAGKQNIADSLSGLSQIGHAADIPPELQGMVALDLIRYYGMIGTVLLGSVLAGAEVETDRRSSDFLKIRRGNTRIDVLGGNQQWAVLLSRLVRQETASRSKGGALKVSKLNTGKFGSRSTTNVVSNFLRSKLAPLPSEGLNIAEGSDLVGNMKWRYPSESGIVRAKYFAQDIAGSVSPMWMEDMAESIFIDPEVTDKDSSVYYYRKMEAPFLSLLNLIGIGVQTYGDEQENRRLE